MVMGRLPLFNPGCARCAGWPWVVKGARPERVLGTSSWQNIRMQPTGGVEPGCQPVFIACGDAIVPERLWLSNVGELRRPGMRAWACRLRWQPTVGQGVHLCVSSPHMCWCVAARVARSRPALLGLGHGLFGCHSFTE